MGWSNAIPNPLEVGGAGQSGEIIVYDAAGILLATINDNGITVYDNTGTANGLWDDLGLTVYGPDDSYSFLTPNVDPGYYGGGAGLALRPAYTGAATISDPSYIIAAEQAGQPILSLNAPTLNNQSLSFIDIFGEDSSGIIPGHISMYASGGPVIINDDVQLGGGDNLDLSTWLTSFVPTWTGSIANPALGNGAVSSRYIYLNKHTVKFSVRYALGTTTNKGNGSYTFSLPVAPSDTSGYGASGSGWVNDSTVAIRPLIATIEGSVVKLWDSTVYTTQFGSAGLAGVIGASAFQFDITYEVP